MTFCGKCGNDIQRKNYESLEVVVDEVDSYLNSTESAVDVLSFWQAKEIMCPKLFKCATWLLSVPATRAFSVAGKTLDVRQLGLQLNPE